MQKLAKPLAGLTAREADGWSAVDPSACSLCGSDSCEDPSHLPPDDRTPPTPNSAASKLVVLSADETIALAQPAEILEGVAFSNCVTVLVSESGAGKTFVLLSMAAAIADGVAWMGHATEHGSVVYIGFEGDSLGVRLRGLKEVGRHRLTHLNITRASDPLSPRVTRDGVEMPSTGEDQIAQALDGLATSLAATGAPPIRLIIFDTVRASLSGSEDSSENVSAYLRAVRRLLARVPRAAAVLAHHAGWQDNSENARKRERGSSAFRGNVDATLFLEAGVTDATRGEAALVLRTLKLRDADKPLPLNLVRKRVALSATDRHGRRLTTCVIECDGRTLAEREAEQTAALGAANQRTDLRILRAIGDRPEMATSQERLRELVNIRKAAVADSLSRLIGLRWAMRGEKRGQPYVVTDAGRQALAGESRTSGSRFPTVPDGSVEL